MSRQPVVDTIEHPNLVESALFRLLLALEEKKAVRLQYGLSVVWLMVEPRNERGADKRALLRRCACLAIGQVRGTDIVSTLSANAIAILLIGTEPNEIDGIVRRVAEAITTQLSMPGGVTWHAGAASYPRHGGNVMEILRQAEALTIEARNEGNQRLRLPIS